MGLIMGSAGYYEPLITFFFICPNLLVGIYRGSDVAHESLFSQTWDGRIDMFERIIEFTVHFAVANTIAYRNVRCISDEPESSL